VPPLWRVHNLTERPPRSPHLQRWVRLALVLLAAVLAGTFVLAAYLNPYKEGRVWLEGTHQQLGLPTCTFKLATGLPCPTCGMTSSFALFVRGDVVNSLRANAAGTVLAVLFLIVIPWSVLSALRGRWLFVRSVEFLFVRVVVGFMIFVLVRWGIVLLEIKLLS
jgi:hypothetical protein